MPARLSGALGVALFAAGALVVPERLDFDASGAEVAAWYEDGSTRIQVHCALLAAAGALLVWFLATAASLARAAGEHARPAALTALGCGLVYVALFMTDVTTLAVGALRPREPEVAELLQDLEFMAIGMASPFGAAILAAFAVLVLRHGVLWPRWVGLLAALAAPLYALRTGTLFSTGGLWAADGLLGIWIPAGALASWVLVSSVALAATSGWSSTSSRGPTR
jgi:hypothetical protein